MSTVIVLLKMVVHEARQNLLGAHNRRQHEHRKTPGPSSPDQHPFVHVLIITALLDSESMVCAKARRNLVGVRSIEEELLFFYFF